MVTVGLLARVVLTCSYNLIRAVFSQVVDKYLKTIINKTIHLYLYGRL